jgi:type IV pilus assembly protein PilW
MNRTFYARQKGLSLVELMVALSLSTFLMLGVMQVFLSSKQTYITNAALSRVQENGRFALDFLSFDIRNAGYKGECISDINNLTSFNDEDAFSLGLKGWNNTLPPTDSVLRSGTDPIKNPINSTDIIIIKHAVNTAGALSNDISSLNDPIKIIHSGAIVENSLLILSDAIGCDLFQVNGAAEAAKQLTAKNPKPLSHTYVVNTSATPPSEPQALNFNSIFYYIGNSSSGSDIPSLKRITYNTGSPSDSEELVEGVVDMQITYGIDTNSDYQVDTYKQSPSSSEWGNVISARISILAISPDKNVVDTNQTLFYPDATGINKTNDFATYTSTAGSPVTVTLKNRRVGQVFTTTVSIRNKLK